MNNSTNMKLYFENYYTALTIFKEFNETVVIIFEQDLWAWLFALVNNNVFSSANTMPIAIKSTNLTYLQTFDVPENLFGFAQSLLMLKKQVAPKAIISFYWSSWIYGPDYLYYSSSFSYLEFCIIQAAHLMSTLESTNYKFDIIATSFGFYDSDWYYINECDTRFWLDTNQTTTYNDNKL